LRCWTSSKSFVPFYVIALDITDILVLYGCETWSVALSEEHEYRVFWNSMLRRIFEPKGQGVMGIKKVSYCGAS
jgi:hypothetical protein